MEDGNPTTGGGVAPTKTDISTNIPSIFTGTSTNPEEILMEFDAYSDKELQALQLELSQRNTFLETETKLLNSYLERVNPTTTSKQDETNQQQQATSATHEETSKDAARREERTKKKKNDKHKEVDKLIQLTPEQKSEIATRELEELRDEIEKQKEEWSKIMDNLKAEMEEIEIRVAEIKKASYEYRRDIVTQAVNPRTGKVIAERILRYYDDKIKSKDAVIEKVRLKNATLKVQKNKLHLQLKQKEEMGEVLHAIDFDQLQIENKQYLTKIEERNAELMKLKMTAGNTVQILNYYKQKLQSLTKESEILRSEIITRKEILSKLTFEAEIVCEEKLKAHHHNKKLKKQIEEFRVPQVMDYVHVKAEQNELQKRLKSWERKVEIGAMQAARVKKIWTQMCLMNQQVHRKSFLPDIHYHAGYHSAPTEFLNVNTSHPHAQ